MAGKHSCSPFFFTREPSMQYMMMSITWNQRNHHQNHETQRTQSVQSAGSAHLDQQVHHVSGHLLDQDVDDPEDLGLGPGQRGGVDVLLGLGVGLGRVVPVNLEETDHTHSEHQERNRPAAAAGSGLTSRAMVVMKAGGRAVAIRDRAWRAERAESAGGLRGRPMLTLRRQTLDQNIQNPKLYSCNMDQTQGQGAKTGPPSFLSRPSGLQRNV